MSKIDILKNAVGQKAGRALLQGKKFTPEMLIGVGVLGVVASTVMASKATLKLTDVVEENLELKSIVDFTRDQKTEEEYTTMEYERDKVVVRFRLIGNLVKLYAPAAIVGVASLSCLIGSHKIMRSRNAALAAAYAVVENSFQIYRNRVVEELGEEKDKEFRYDLEGRDKAREAWKEENPGKEPKMSVTGFKDPNDISMYARFYDETNPNWRRNAGELNHMFVKTQQEYANHKLRAQGHLFLNEVYDSLGIPRSKAGAIVGWIISREDGHDNFVDFGISRSDDEGVRDFVNGYGNGVLLDFNVDGPIYDLI